MNAIILTELVPSLQENSVHDSLTFCSVPAGKLEDNTINTTCPLMTCILYSVQLALDKEH